jgi:hypothetical protein
MHSQDWDGEAGPVSAAAAGGSVSGGNGGYLRATEGKERDGKRVGGGQVKEAQL